jgi:predicted neuraminidase
MMKITHREFLPSKTRSVHAATVEMWDGHPVFSWFGGTREGCQDVSIFVYNLNDKKDTIVLGHSDEIPRWNPILVSLGCKLILFEKFGEFCDRWQTFIHDITSWDINIPKNEILSKRILLPAGLNGPVKSKPLIKNEIMYCGSSFETLYDWTSYIEEYDIRNGELIFRNRSKPLTEKKKVIYRNYWNGSTERSLGIIQPSLCEINNNVYAFFRSSNGLNSIYFSEYVNSEWSDPVPTNLPNPNSAVDVVACNGCLYLAWNPDPHNRFPLMVSKIKRDGQSSYFMIEDEICISNDLNYDNFAEKGCNSPELSYPYIIASDGKLHLVYTWGRKNIEYCVLEV